MKISELSKSTHTNIETIHLSDWLMVIDIMMKKV